MDADRTTSAQARAQRWTAAAVALVAAGLLSLFVVPAARAAGLWWNGQWGYRVGVTVSANGVARTDKPVDVAINYQALVGSLGGAGTFDPNSVRVLEVDGSGNAFGQPLPSQYDTVTGDTTFLMSGATGAGSTRSFHVYFATTAAGIAAPGTPTLVNLTNSFDAGQSAYKVSNQVGDWYYQVQGGSFSSLVDHGGKNWISYNGGAGASGEYRGIPNFPNPLGYFHPGFTLSNSQVISAGPLRAIVQSTSNNGTWAYRSVFYPTYVTSTVTKWDPNKAYWWLYEGTPGGHNHYNELSGDILVRSDGGQTSLTAESKADLPGEEWVYFGVPSQNRSLFMAQHDDDAFPDDYFALYGEPGGSMTVWGFGRRGGDGGDYLHGAHTFTMGLMDTVNYGTAAGIVRNAYRGVGVQVGAAEAKGSSPVGTVPTVPPTVTTGLPSVIPASGYASLASPVRLFDSRDGGAGGPLQFGAPRTVQVTGAGKAPNDATAAVLNVTAVSPDTGGYLTVYPSGGAEPGVSNVNYRAGDIVPNLVTVALGGGGAVSVADGAGSTHFVVDLFGYYAPSVAGGRYHPVNPARILDTRNGGGPVAGGTSRSASVNGVDGVVAGHVTAVAMNVTVDGPTEASFVAAYPGGGAVPGTSNLNFNAGQTVPNAVISGVGPGGEVTAYNAVGSTHIVLDVVGWYDDGDGSVTGGLQFHPLAPMRVLDTRPNAALADTVARDTTIRNSGGVANDAQAVALNVTAVDAMGDSYLTVWPTGETRPTASTQNMVAGTTRANAALAKLGSGGAVSAMSVGAGTHLLYDVFGYFS